MFDRLYNRYLGVPSLNANYGHSFEVPIDISEVTGLSGLRAVNCILLYDQDLLQFKNVRKGSLTAANFSLEYNSAIPGEVSLALAASSPVSGSGNLAYIEFLVLDSEKTTCNLTLENMSLNSGAIPAGTTGGVFSVSQTHQVDGTINYYSNYLPVENVNLVLKGDKGYNAATDNTGKYSLVGIGTGAYTLQAVKNDQVAGISAYDASLILQAAVGSLSLNSNQQIAADVGWQ